MYHYLARIYATLHSRGNVEIQSFDFEQPTQLDGWVRSQLSFYDGSTLIFEEKVVKRGRSIVKISYRYHYQRSDGTLIFRYDNAPHHPDIPTYPDHVHVGGHVQASAPPDLSQVLHQIDEILYPHKQGEER